MQIVEAKVEDLQKPRADSNLDLDENSGDDDLKGWAD